MKLTDDWFTALSENEAGDMMVVCGRDNITPFIESGKFKERAEVYWRYKGETKGMPSDEEARRMEPVQEALKKAMEKDKLAILTGVYTGGDERIWVFYTRNVPAFGQMLNKALEPFELLPIEIYTEKDPDWTEYHGMYELKPENGEGDTEEDY